MSYPYIGPNQNSFSQILTMILVKAINFLVNRIKMLNVLVLNEDFCRLP